MALDIDTVTHAELLHRPLTEIRRAIRRGAFRGQTAGLAPDRLQANLVILAGALAEEFRRFCEANPRPCPLVGASAPGEPMMRSLGDIDIRTDVPEYNVYREGRLVATVPDIRDLWQDDMVAFALGCSFTFERALAAAGIPMRHIEADRTVPMYRTNIPLVPAGPFRGTMVVSMRPIPEAQVERAVEISGRFPHAHGAPVHVGEPAAIGIADLDRPDWGEPAPFEPGDMPVFWACGVTPQNVLAAARPPLCITHRPGRMLITDLDGDRVR